MTSRLDYEIEKGFLNVAMEALRKEGSTALEFLKQNPGLSKLSLAKKLNRGANVIGLLIAIYQEAQLQGNVRDVAKNLLFRQIRDEFPTGWTSLDNVSAAVKIGSWSHSIRRFVNDDKCASCAEKVLRSIAIEQPPKEGWIPDSENDQLILKPFNKHWPIEK